MKLISSLLWFVIALSSAASHAAPVTRYIHNDALGSPVAATDQNGDVVWKEEYKPFGERIIKDGNADTQKRWFTGHVQDKDTGLVYMGARFYDPSIGRFLSPDPVGFSPNTPMMFNRYAYANNNPYKYVDPDGRAPHRWADGNYSDNDGQANPGWSAQINRAQGQIGYGLAEGWQYSPAIMVGAGEGVALFGLLKQGVKQVTKYAVKDFAEVASKVSQKQLRHITDRNEYRGGGVLNSLDDAQKVLSSYKSGATTILGKNKQGFPVVRYDGVTGTNINASAGITNQPTNIFMIKGTKSPSVVPMNPNWKP